LLADEPERCYNAGTYMADWKQITARIRRARTSKDPAGQLAALYEKTHDAMVAFELAKYFEASANNADAAKWYGTAAERFRRADWKTKAQEAAVRLGAATGGNAAGNSTEEASSAILPVPVPEPGMPFEQNAAAFEAIMTGSASGSIAGEALNSSDTEVDAETDTSAAKRGSKATAPLTELDSDEKRRRRRGRRGGRNRRKVGTGTDTAGASRVPSTPNGRRGTISPATASTATTPSEPEAPQTTRRGMPTLPVEPLPESTTPGPRGRYGDPGLSSRISLLEMQFRRLLTCEAVKLEEANHAPVGPGVFVLTDSDLTSYYYVESCQTLRIAVANLLRGNASRRGAESITKQLAEHLGITEARVPKYLAEHCVVRWLQLDEGASHFAHFVIAVLRPILNE
jgi:hypothetical protein